MDVLSQRNSLKDATVPRSWQRGFWPLVTAHPAGYRCAKIFEGQRVSMISCATRLGRFTVQRSVAAWLALIALAMPAFSQTSSQTLAEQAGIAGRPHLSFYGTPGLIDMPSGYGMPDADFAFTASSFGPSSRVALAFQILPRVTGVFRYSRIEEPGDSRALFDRSFDIVYQAVRETQWRPAVAIGIRDFGGTEVLGAEYVAASKRLPGGFEVTAGLGWGRYASEGGFKNPLGVLASEFETRPGGGLGDSQGGELDFDDLFRGDAALFGGVAWRPNDKWTVLFEYSSDAYTRETGNDVLERSSSLNFGASYRVSPDFDLGLYYLYGSELGLRLSYVMNPKVPPAASGIEPGPQPVQLRPRRAAAPAAWSTNWSASETMKAALTQQVIAGLSPEGLALESLTLEPTEARVALRNQRFDQSAQAVGRAARALTRTLPASVETFHIVLIEQGMATTQVTLQRSDLEDLEFAPDNAWQSYVRADISDAAGHPNVRQSLVSPRLTFSASTYVEQSLFDPNEPVLFDFGVRGTLRYEPRPGFVLDVSARQPLYSNRDNTNRVSNSVLPFVRSEQDDFNRGGQPKLDRLTFSHYFRPGTDLYGRVTAGYLELAYAGVSGELLWKPTTSRLALGIEINAVHQREPGNAFELGSGVFDNDTVTGHASLYYNFDNGFTTQVDVGRYLAEDWGSTFTLTREFANGWQVGAFFTLTDVSSEDFGEGSFDKGIFFTIPTAWIGGQPSREDRTSIVRPILRDGGARVHVSNRLYEMVRQDSEPVLSDSWGRFWR